MFASENLKDLTEEELFKSACQAMDEHTHLIENFSDGNFEMFEHREERLWKCVRLFLAEIRNRGLNEEFDDYSLCGGEWDEE